MIIKRYMNFEKFVYLLNNGLFCPKSSLFEDQWEGLIARPDKRNDENYINNFENAREWIYVSCWHKETPESYAMWKIYGEHQYSVCVQTTTDKLERLFEKWDLVPAVYACNVVYGSPSERVQSDAFSVIKESSSIGEKWWYATNHGIKHKAYSFEEEYRLIMVDGKFNLDNKNDLEGITLKIVPKEIVEDIIVSPRAPDWFYNIVSDISGRYGLSLKIRKSHLEFVT